jgi:2-polyprenyl-3-methyl-5-hydroxy-6-metoxy-1,4-benzoquinol methylase
MNTCKICNTTKNNKVYLAREMMFGFRDQFEYFECSNCGCLQISKFPENISKYYSARYYSLKKIKILEQWAKGQRLSYYIHRKNLAGFLLSQIYASQNRVSELMLKRTAEWIKRAKLKFKDSILDIGCGNGTLLFQMHAAGFRNLAGVDPYLEQDYIYKNGIRLLKRELPQIEGQYDFIMLHHAFEHMSDPINALKEIYRICKPGKIVLIRIPTSSSFAWRKYGINWIQLDAPRHFFLHSRKSMEILAQKVGFEISDIVYDSTEFQFWGSEQLLQDIPLRAENSYGINPKQSIFSKQDITSYRQRSEELNNANDGDSACFFLYKS